MTIPDNMFSYKDPTGKESETDYSVDSKGEVKLDRHGDPVPRYELDAHSGKPKRDNKGRPIVKRKRKTSLVPN